MRSQPFHVFPCAGTRFSVVNGTTAPDQSNLDLATARPLRLGQGWGKSAPNSEIRMLCQEPARVSRGGELYAENVIITHIVVLASRNSVAFLL